MRRRKAGRRRRERMGTMIGSLRRKEDWGWELRGQFFFGEFQDLYFVLSSSISPLQLCLSSSSLRFLLLDFNRWNSQHILDNQPLGLYAVKKVAVGESHDYLLKFVPIPFSPPPSIRFPFRLLELTPLFYTSRSI